LPYVVFQTAYFVLYRASDNSFTLSYVKPIWVMWYLFALMVYYLLIPIFETDNIKVMGVIFFITLVLSIVAGFDKNLGVQFKCVSNIRVYAIFRSRTICR
jgi:surface polysaccharide O-acyltransferase-like enzyme